jgi:hypothetical protein
VLVVAGCGGATHEPNRADDLANLKKIIGYAPAHCQRDGRAEGARVYRCDEGKFLIDTGGSGGGPVLLNEANHD